MSKFAVNTILKKTKPGWPIIMFPYYKRSHTLVYTGKEWVKDVKFSVGFATLCLTERILCCKLIFPPILILEIELSDITSISKLKDKYGILEIRFSRATKGLLSRFVLAGDAAIPRDRALLNLGDELEIWYRELSKRISARPEAADSTM